MDQHLVSKKYIRAVRYGESMKSIDGFLVPKFIKLDNKILAVEAAIAFHTVKHHQSFRSTSCTTSLVKKMIDDSQIAAKLSSAKTKTRAIAVNVVAPYCTTDFLRTLDTIPYVPVSTDGSNHRSLKLFPILIQYFDPRNGGIVTKILQLDSLPDEKAATITDYLTDQLRKHNLMEKCIAFSANNCNTNFGGL